MPSGFNQIILLIHKSKPCGTKVRELRMQRFYLTFSDILPFLLICIFHFSTDQHLKLIKGSKSFLPFENSFLF